MSSWDPMVIWKGIRETTEEKMKDDSRNVKATDFLDWFEVNIELGQFIMGYSKGRIHENGWPQMLKLKDWPSPTAPEDFLLYQRPNFISKLPLLEYIHSKWGLLNVAAKLPHYSLQNDVGPKIFISYGMNEELGRGDSVNNLHFSMRDMDGSFCRVFKALQPFDKEEKKKVQQIHRKKQRFISQIRNTPQHEMVEKTIMCMSEAFMAGIAAGAVESVVSSPFELIKLCAQVNSASRILSSDTVTARTAVSPLLARLLPGYSPDMRTLNHSVGLLFPETFEVAKTISMGPSLKSGSKVGKSESKVHEPDEHPPQHIS